MKYIIVLLILVFPFLAMGQNPNKDSLAQSLINDLKDSWNLGINDDINQPVNIRVFNKFKSLFDSTATIDDEFNVLFKFNPDSNKSTYQVDSNKPFDIYAHDIALQVGRLTIESDNAKTIIPSISSSGKEYVYKISRKITAYKLRKFVLEDASIYFNREIKIRKIEFTDHSVDEEAIIMNNKLYNNPDSVYQFQSNVTLTITLRFLNDSMPKISRIQAAPVSPINYINDKDRDGILDGEEDSLSKSISGDFTANGYPDHDFDGTPDGKDGCKDIFGSLKNRGCPAEFFNNNFSIFGFTGVLFNTCNIKLPEPDQFGYSNVDILQSQTGSFKNPKFSSTISTTFGGDFSYYFGKRAKHFGISLGMNYTGFNGEYVVENPVINTYKSNDGDYDYRRRVTMRDSSVETLNYHVLNFPLMFKYRTKFGIEKNKRKNRTPKWSMEISAGPSFVYFNNASSYNMNMDFEGLYQVDTLSKDKITWYDYFDNGSTWNVLLTTNDINNQSEIPGVGPVFSSLDSSGYDFKSNKNYSGKDKNATRYSIALNLNLDLNYSVNDFMNLKFGLGMMVAPALAGASHYTPMDKTTDEYNSLYRSKIKSTYFSYGIHIGIVIVLDKLDKKLDL
ncbi:MAG: hypothetical protein ABI723_20060 [Bacteroidia bacterium]